MKRENTTNIIILSIVLSIIIALIPYLLLIHFVVDVNLQKNNPDFVRVKNIQTFYEQTHEGDIFIIGNSLVSQGIDGYLVEDLLKKNLINRSVYVLGEGSDSPLERVVTLDNLIASRPGVVVVGLFCCSLTMAQLGDRFILFKPISDEYKFLFNDEQLKLSQQSFLERSFYERKYLIEYLKNYLYVSFKGKNSTRAGLRNQPYNSNFKDPWVYMTNLTEVQKGEDLKYRQSSANFKEKYRDDSLFSNQQKNALQYTIKKLRQNNISVIIVIMPLTPGLSDLNSESSRHNLSQTLNSTGVLWYDYEKIYVSEYFSDVMHLNAAGRTDFSSRIATVLIDYSMKGG